VEREANAVLARLRGNALGQLAPAVFTISGRPARIKQVEIDTIGSEDIAGAFGRT
jgi:uncharacterized protein YggU (UPF0235/DUF167 family)